MLHSINPHNKQLLKEFSEHKESDVESILQQASTAFTSWHNSSFDSRSTLLNKLANLLEDRQGTLATLITLEMGKPMAASIAEIEKCVTTIRYFATNAQSFLTDQIRISDASESYIKYEPLGVILGVMPWNFPFWQVIRFAIPAIAAGNTVVVKHASNVPQCAQSIHQLFQQSGFPEGIFSTLLIHSDTVQSLIKDPRIKAVSLTGSTDAGRSVAKHAGSNLKKVILELGGNDPFIVLQDADPELAAENAVQSRLLSNGQSCIAAKRFIVHSQHLHAFTEKFADLLKQQIVGDPIEKSTTVGPLATEKILNTLQAQLGQSVQMGATIISGGNRLELGGYHFEPTLLTNVTSQMPVWSQETFGPLASIQPFDTVEQAVHLANETEYGLGASIWSNNIERAKDFVTKLEAGSIFINGIVKSDPRLPFGGIKNSGFGRELGEEGLREFTNIKTVWIR